MIYKLKSEIKAFILEKKKEDPTLSCRGLASLIEEKFKISVSKSSINSLIKQAGLSMPVGRRRKIVQTASVLPVPELPVKPPVELITSIPSENKTEVIFEPSVQSAPEIPTETPSITPTEPSAVKPPEGQAPISEQVSEVPLKEQPEVQFETTDKEPLGNQTTGAILLKAADYLLGGISQITELISRQWGKVTTGLFAKTEALLYGSLFDQPPYTKLAPDSELWPLINHRFSSGELLTYLNDLQNVTALDTELRQSISALLPPVRGIKVVLSDKSILYLDGQLHTIWSTPHIPYDFSISINKIKSYIKRYFQEESAFVFFMAPGYDSPINEFFDFIFSLDTPERKKIVLLTFYGSKFEDLEHFRVEQIKKRFFIFGIWPWQFGHYRKVKSIGDFQRFYLEKVKKSYYLAPLEIELLQPSVNNIVALRGCALKREQNTEIRLLILSNLSTERVDIKNLAQIYLSCWPNLEEAFQDFSRKIELFTYLASSQRFFSLETLNLSSLDSVSEIGTFFSQYLKALDLYVRWYFLSLGYGDKDFSITKERFYELKVNLEKQEEVLQVTFQPASGYAYLKDLEYACRRINEQEITSPEGKRLWFSVE